MKREVKTIETYCDICGEQKEVGQTLFTHVTGYSNSGSSCGIHIEAVPFGSNRHDSCKDCNQIALYAASKTLPQWNHLLRGKALLLDLIAWYGDGQREMKQLDRIYDSAVDLFGGQ